MLLQETTWLLSTFSERLTRNTILAIGDKRNMCLSTLKILKTCLLFTGSNAYSARILVNTVWGVVSLLLQAAWKYFRQTFFIIGAFKLEQSLQTETNGTSDISRFRGTIIEENTPVKVRQQYIWSIGTKYRGFTASSERHASMPASTSRYVVHKLSCINNNATTKPWFWLILFPKFN